MYTPALIVAAFALLNAARLAFQRAQASAATRTVTRRLTLRPVKPATRIVVAW